MMKSPYINIRNLNNEQEKIKSDTFKPIYATFFCLVLNFDLIY